MKTGSDRGTKLIRRVEITVEEFKTDPAHAFHTALTAELVMLDDDGQPRWLIVRRLPPMED